MTYRLPIQVKQKSWMLPAISAPLTVIINSIYFGNGYFSDFFFFFTSTVITFTVLFVSFFGCSLIAIMLLKRFSGDLDVFKRLVFMIISFVLIAALMQYVLFRIYAAWPSFAYRLSENDLAWTVLSIALANIFFTFLIEGVYRFDAWQKSMKESELLIGNYRLRKLNALRSHISPHFLFNNLNTLSSLIEDDPDTAETFLDEMTKVYRYMLKSGSGDLVALDIELDFLESYLFLLQKRFGPGLWVDISIESPVTRKLVVPMLLQSIIENSLIHNSVTRKKPLHISVSSPGSNLLLVDINLQPKIITADLEPEKGLDVIAEKYRLIGKNFEVADNKMKRQIVIELINEN